MEVKGKEGKGREAWKECVGEGSEGREGGGKERERKGEGRGRGGLYSAVCRVTVR